MKGYCLFNVKNYILTRLPILFNNFRFNNEDNLEKAVIDALKSIEFDDNDEFKQLFLKGLVSLPLPPMKNQWLGLIYEKI